jgi:sporulation protein YlmC with PRC-barrel domain
MTRFLTTMAIGLLLQVAPALAEPQTAPDAPQAAQRDAAPPAAMPSNPADATNPNAAQVPPGATAPAPSAAQHPSGAPQPEQSAEAAPASSPFLTKQDASEILAANLIGQPVLDADNESIGEVTDLITDKGGRIRALLIGAGGFLGIGQKDLAIRYRDITVTRDENDDLIIKANVTKEMVAQAPDYETLDEQQMIVGEKSDREDSSQKQ